jgi:AbrB family looped-hinge helix DNA binding protein
MKTTIDSAGRIVIPRDIRRAAGMKAGTEVELHLRDGVVEIHPTFLPVRLEKRGFLTVAVPLVDVEPLTVEQVNETLRRIRERTDEYEEYFEKE